MKKLRLFVCIFALLLSLAACAGQDSGAVNTGESAETLPSDMHDHPQPDLSAEPLEDKEEEQVGMEQVSTDRVGTEQVSPEPENQSNLLVAYFSATGNTRALAEYAADAVGADLYEIVPEEPYTEEDLDYGNDQSRTSLEMNDADARPAISGSVENMEQYEIIFLGYPIWWGDSPRIVATFVETYDFSGKTIVPFCTSGSSGIGSSASNLHALAADAVWLDGARLDSSSTREDMVNWINGLGLGLTAE